MSDPNDGGLKDARDEDGKIIISASTLYSLLQPQLKQISARYNIMCGCECFISAKSIHSSFLYWRDRYLKDQSQNAQSIRSVDKANQLYTTYKNTVMPHGSHIYTTASDMANATMCTYPQSEHSLPHWKCVLQCCADCTCINIPDQETTKKHEETKTSNMFHIYHTIGRCATHDRISLKDKNIC